MGGGMKLRIKERKKYTERKERSKKAKTYKIKKERTRQLYENA